MHTKVSSSLFPERLSTAGREDTVDYDEACSFIYSFVDWEKRGGRPTRSNDIHEFSRFLSTLGDPHLSYPTIHVVGTNGKGSVCAMLSTILREHGLNVGSYTSPHLVTVRERIAVNGTCISEDAFARTISILKQHEPTANISSPGYRTTFTLLTAAAFRFFADSKVDVAVVEAGLGGRLDATVVVKPEITIITPIHRDHMITLGTTLDVIARDKAAVIRNDNILITAPQTPAVRSVIRRVADAKHPRRWIRIGFDIRYRSRQPEHGKYGVSLRLPDRRIQIAKLPLRGKHQVVNCVTAVTAAESLYPDISSETVVRGIEKTIWPGRLDLRGGHPDILLDGAHNQQAVRSLVTFVRDHLVEDYDRMACLFALSRGKEARTILGIIRDLDIPLVLCTADIHRGLSVPVIDKEARRLGMTCLRADSPVKGLQTARRMAGKKGLVIVCGSLYLIGTIIDLLRRSSE